MIEINYDYQKLNEFTEDIKRSFKGIDSVISGMQLEKGTLKQELDQINTLEQFTSETFKRKAELPRIIQSVDDGLKEAIEERRNIQEKVWNEISNKAGVLENEYRRFINEQLSEQEQEITALLKEASDKINQIKNTRNKMNTTFTQLVVNPINNAVKVNSNNSKVLSSNYYNGTKTLKERVERDFK